MTIDKALKILNLKENFKENELKQAYLTLMKKYHIDSKSKDVATQKIAAEKLKAVNEAKTTLCNLLKINDDLLIKDDINEKKLLKHKKSILKKLTIFSCETNINLLIKYNSEINDIILRSKEIIKNSSNKENIDSEYKKYVKIIKKIFIKFQNEFFEQNKIDKNDIKITINYNCNIESFYSQLLKIKDKYIYISKIKKDLYFYKAKIEYNTLEIAIDEIINEQFKKFENSHYLNYENFIENLKTKIDDLFKEYNQTLIKLEDLLTFLQEFNYNDTDFILLQNKIKELYNNLKINYSGNLIEEAKKYDSVYIKFKNLHDLKKDSNIIEFYINSITQKYTKLLHSFIYPQQFINIKIATYIFNEVLEIIEKLKLGEISIDSFKKLNELTFSDYNYDRVILNKVKYVTSKSKIYVLNKKNSCLNDIIIGEILQENDNYITIQGFEKYIYNSISKKTMLKEDFYKMYIPLEECLENCIFSGKRSKIFPHQIILYYNDFISFSYNKTNDEIEFIQNHNTYELNEFVPESFKNILYVIDKIKEKLTTEINSQEDPKIKKRGNIYN